MSRLLDIACAFLGVEVSRREVVDRYYLFKWRDWALFLHHIKRSDPPDVMHSHPWSWASLIMRGSYYDRRQETFRLVRWFNFCPAGTPHQVFLRSEDAWTLIVHGPKRCPWATFDLDGMLLEVEPWTGTENAGRTSYVSLAPLAIRSGV
jgi:hypothetical protein